MDGETSTYEGALSFAVLACGSRQAKGGSAFSFCHHRSVATGGVLPRRCPSA